MRSDGVLSAPRRRRVWRCGRPDGARLLCSASHSSPGGRRPSTRQTACAAGGPSPPWICARGAPSPPWTFAWSAALASAVRAAGAALLVLRAMLLVAVSLAEWAVARPAGRGGSPWRLGSRRMTEWPAPPALAALAALAAPAAPAERAPAECMFVEWMVRAVGQAERRQESWQPSGTALRGSCLRCAAWELLCSPAALCVPLASACCGATVAHSWLLIRVHSYIQPR